MSVSQTTLDIAEICVQQGVTQLVMSPGSRNAPLALAFHRHPKITARIIPDERAAGYMALGISQSIRQPVLLLSTSGTAGLNYGPAIAEAYYQQVPLLIFTADRPPEWIDQKDGQAIRQYQVFANHTKRNYQLPVAQEHEDAIWHVHRTINEAINIAKGDIPGPVHINAPFREPFYPGADQSWIYNRRVPVVTVQNVIHSLSSNQWSSLTKKWKKAPKILIVGGQSPASVELCKSLESIQTHLKVPIVGDVISNLHQLANVIKHPEHILGQSDQILEKLQPDLLVTFGGGVISKNLKLFLRKYPAKEHWHLQKDGYPADCYKSINEVIPIDPTVFFNQLAKLLPAESDLEWYTRWQQFEQQVSNSFRKFIDRKEFNELQAVGSVLDLAGEVHLHLANSSVVRWVDYFGVSPETIEVSSNRGTSGIDGCSSVAVGHSWSNGRQNLLITGDLAFFYDRNAFWHQYQLPNLKVVLINNHGGGIFRLIDGPRDQPELEDLFVTKQSLSAKNTADDFGMRYFYCDSNSNLEEMIKELFESSTQVSLLELVVPNNMQGIYKELKATIKNYYE